ncbi:MAG: helix-turn-helix transcriptional regulator [Actinobacteria bacterium]|nr:helix-turn-helix transcriptional regulator [Actinomycetota bacterium]
MEDAPWAMGRELPIVDAPVRERADAARNRRRILAAAERLFNELGVEQVSMDAIAAEACVGKGTLFRRFGDRAGLALALLQEQTVVMQEGIIRGPAPLGPGAPPKERLKAMARAQLALLAEHGDLIAAAEARRGGARFQSGPYTFLRMHAGMLIREADPEADWEVLADILLAALASDAFFYWNRIREHELERIAAAFDMLVDRLLT